MHEKKAARPLDAAGRPTPRLGPGLCRRDLVEPAGPPRAAQLDHRGPLRLIEQVLPKGDAEPKALCCYGVRRTDTRDILLRFVNGRPVSHVTTAFLAWVCARLARERKRVLVLIWDNASWHMSREVRTWIRQHHQRVKCDGGVRLLTCRLPIKSPWLNPIEPHWVHGKRAIVEPERLLTATEVMSRVYSYFGAEQVAPLTQKVA